METPTNDFSAAYGGPAGNSANSHRLLTILDWDDTILPTKDIARHGGKVTLSQRYVSVAATVIELLLSLSSDNGLIILSSSTEGWVRQSCNNFFPELRPLIERAQIVHTPKETRQLGLKQKCPTIVKLGNDFCRNVASGAGNAVETQILLIGNMRGDVEPAKTLRMLYPNVSVKTCLLKEVPTTLELERELTYLLHSLPELLLNGDNGGVDDYSIAEAGDLASIDQYSEVCAARRAMLKARQGMQKQEQSSNVVGKAKAKHGYRSLVCTQA
ncbi:hypothetical protein FOL47_001154 [Perkinsus chesapeaki]|uniref:Uncharacterized protein n=1 Tax=Perkinsus chesapeaki TaxID=330153 RepID=A0A7J6MJT6_PERCH|nr:hypothetical protein FOL47_001154 [Perkinsus chesapeaki]